jgi:hypothetical protein
MLFSRHKVAYEKSRNIRRNMISFAELKKTFFAEIDKIETASWAADLSLWSRMARSAPRFTQIRAGEDPPGRAAQGAGKRHHSPMRLVKWRYE